MYFIQKITVHGNSAHFTMTRALMHALEVRPGDFLEIKTETDPDGYLAMRVRAWVNRENATVKSPGAVPELTR